MEVTIQSYSQYPEWAKTRGALVEFTMDFRSKGSLFRKGRILANKGERAYVLTNYERECRTIAVQPMDRYYCIHDVPIEILASCNKNVNDL